MTLEEFCQYLNDTTEFYFYISYEQVYSGGNWFFDYKNEEIRVQPSPFKKKRASSNFINTKVGRKIIKNQILSTIEKDLQNFTFMNIEDFKRNPHE